MKSYFLSYIYRKYKPYFYRFFVDEFFEDIPLSVQEPAMKFLSEGKDRLERWSLFQARVIQSKITRDPTLIHSYDGMLLMLKLLLLHTKAPERKSVPAPAEKPKRDDVAEASKAIDELKKLSTGNDVAS